MTGQWTGYGVWIVLDNFFGTASVYNELGRSLSPSISAQFALALRIAASVLQSRLGPAILSRVACNRQRGGCTLHAKVTLVIGCPGQHSFVHVEVSWHLDDPDLRGLYEYTWKTQQFSGLWPWRSVARTTC